MPPGKGFSNPIVFEDNFQGWRKILVARSEGCKQRTDPYLFSPDKTKLRYWFSFVLFHWSKSHAKCVSCSSFPIFHPFSFTFRILPCSYSHQYYVYVPERRCCVHVVDAAVFMSWMLLLCSSWCCCCSHCWCCCVHVPYAAVFTSPTLLCSHLRFCCLHIGIVDIAVFRSPTLLSPRP